MKRLLLFLIAFNISIFSLYSQETAKTGADEIDNSPKYDVSFDMKQLVYHKYRFTKNIRVKRVMEDSTMNEYEKTVTYYFNMFVPGPEDENGFLLVEVSSDSMDYSFAGGDRKIDYFTQDYNNIMPINFLDYLIDFLPNGKFFTLLYSNYGDVAQLEGERLNAERKEISQTSDSLKRNLLVKAVDDNKLKFLFNVVKNIYPPFEVKKDTTWSNELLMYVTNAPLYGEVKHKFDGYYDKEYHIITTIDSLKLVDVFNNYYFPDLDTYGTINGGVSTGEMKTDLYTNGTIKYMRTNLKTLLSGSIGNLDFKQIIESNYTWDLLGRFTYK